MIRSWVLSSSESWRALPVPEDTPVAHASGSDPDRILLMGAGIAVSYGVLSHDLGLAGNLARRLTALTGRGTSVDVRAFPEITMKHATDVVSTPEVARYGAIVATLGGLTAVTLGPSDSWRADLEALLSEAEKNSPSTKIFLVGVPRTSSMVRMPRLYTSLVERHTARINAITQEVCELSSNAMFIPFDPAPVRILEDMNRDLYREWAELLAWPVADALDSAEHFPRSSSQDNDEPVVRAEREDARQAALDRMHLTDAQADEEITQVIATVRDLFGASGAGLNVIDRARQWVMAAVGMNRDDMPRDESICSTTISMPDILIVEDTHQDERFQSMGWATGDDPIRFYAGYPIEDPDGYRLGALCVVDTKPRSFSATDKALLRELAMRVQTLLWERSRSTVHNAHTRGQH